MLNRGFLYALNGFFHGIHLFIIGLSATAWIFDVTRIFHLLLQLSIFFSWFVIGKFKNELGFCLITDIQWRIMDKLNIKPLTTSYIKYLADVVVENHFTQMECEKFTFYTFFVTTALSLVLFIMF